MHRIREEKQGEMKTFLYSNGVSLKGFRKCLKLRGTDKVLPFNLQTMRNFFAASNRLKRKKEREVAQSCQTLCNPVNCSPPGSSVHGILQAGILEWVAISSTINYIIHKDIQLSHKARNVLIGSCRGATQWCRLTLLCYPQNVGPLF